MRVTPTGLVAVVVSLGAVLSARQSPDLTRINPKFLMTVEDAQQLHAAKDAQGPALSGNASWRNFVGIIETRLRAANAVGFVKNAWTFDRWSTTEFPDASGWSLSSDGKPIRAASYGANSGTTPPAEHVYEYPGDYMFLSSPETFPDPRVPTKVTRTVTMRAEMRQHSLQIRKLIEGKATGAVFVFDASYDRLAGLYTFGVPANHQLPTLYVDRAAGRQLIGDAKAGKRANLKSIGPAFTARARARGSASARSDARAACRRLRRWATWARTGAPARASAASTRSTSSIRSRRWRS